MSQAEYEVIVTVAFRVPINIDYVDGYPPDVVKPHGRMLQGKRLACAMARFDAETGDEPMDVYATDQTVISVAVAP